MASALCGTVLGTSTLNSLDFPAALGSRCHSPHFTDQKSEAHGD